MSIYNPKDDDLMELDVIEDEKIEYRDREIFTRHGGAYDRGSADAYYGRCAEPHYFTGDTYNSTKIEEVDMSVEEVEAYMTGYNETTDRKDWG